MSEEIRFRVNGQPVPKARPRVVITDPYQKPHAITPARTAAYQSRVGYAALQVKPWPEPSTATCSVRMWFYIAPRGRRKIDLDNLVKAILDGITSVLIVDDDQIMHLEALKVLDSDDPHAEVAVTLFEEVSQ